MIPGASGTFGNALAGLRREPAVDRAISGAASARIRCGDQQSRSDTVTRGRDLPANRRAWRHHLRLIALALATAASMGSIPGHAQSGEAVPPLPPYGGYAVACSNVEQDFSRVAPAASYDDYWTGRVGYVTDLLVDAVNSIVVHRSFPDDRELFSSYAGSTFPYLVLVCYPTDFANPRAGYLLPTGHVIPHMQRGAEAPIFPAGSARYPLVLYSHGLAGSPTSGDYIESVKQIASYGHVTVAVFHGDLRFASIDLENLDDVLYALLHLRDFVAMQAMRPLSLSSALDRVLADPGYRDRIDPGNIGGFGASLGAQSLLLMAGARLTVSLGLSSRAVMERDPRLKAAATYVPYFGNSILPAFGRRQEGLDGIVLPLLAISGTADTTAPIASVEEGVRRLSETRQLVAFTGLEHGYDARYASDLDTWLFTFLAGQLTDNPFVRAESARMDSVAGGMEDVQRLDYMAPRLPADPNEADVFEFHNPDIDHYFITAAAAEAAMLDSGTPVAGWHRTGLEFKLRPAGSPLGLLACRFFGTPPLGPNSHFYTIDADECAKVKANPSWTYEGVAFNADAPVAGTCAPDRIPVMRLYNDGMGGEANHRYTTSRSEARQMHANGWIVEGNVLCAIP